MKIIVICLVIAAFVVGGAYLLSNFGIWPFGRGRGEGTGDGTVDSPVNNQSEIHDEAVIERPQSFLIEIREDKIVYNGEEVSLNELEIILQQFKDLEEIWILEDSYRADKFIYDEVKNLLERYKIIFKE